MKTIQRYAELYKLFFVQNIKMMMEYRVDFIIGVLSTFLVQGAGIISMWIIFSNIKSLNGWTFSQIALVYGFLTMAKAFNHIFFDNLWVIGNTYIRTGRFDMLLLRPINPLFHVVADKVQRDGFGNLVVGVLIIINCWSKAGVPITFTNILLAVAFVIFGGLIFVAINIILATTSFWVVNQIMVMWSVFQFNEFALYPINIFNKYIRILITWIIPYAFASFYPVSYLLNRQEGNIIIFLPIVAIILFTLGIKFWNFGLKHYESAGG